MDIATVLRISASHIVTVEKERTECRGRFTNARSVLTTVQHFPRCLRPSDPFTDFQATDFPRAAILGSLSRAQNRFLSPHMPHGCSVGTHQLIPICTLVN